MKELVVVSGKGGVGKTTVSGSLAYLFGRMGLGPVIADADVDTPSLGLILGFKAEEREEAYLTKKASIDAGKCTACGLCIRTCPYGALEEGPGGVPEVIWYLCEGCGACLIVCPREAISLVEARTGELLRGRTRYGQTMVTAQLEIGEHNSGLLVSQVRIKARGLAAEEDTGLLLVDGAPGIGCPVVSSLVGADMALIVAEPTPSSLQGALRVLQVARHFGIRACSVLNKSDISDFREKAVRVLEQEGAPVLAEIPYDRAVVDALADERPVVEFSPSSEASEALRGLAEELADRFLA